jgi:anthranilate synthase component 1
MKVVSNVAADGVQASQEASDKIEAIAAAMRSNLMPEPRTSFPVSAQASPPLVSNFSPSQFCDIVKVAKEYILSGDAFQIVLSQRLRRKTVAEPFSIYRALRMLNPSPYMFYLDFGDFQLIGSSPEMLVKLEEGLAETRPIAGTRPRGSNDEEDKATISRLLADPKERAEHTMLVDLGRNDIGRVSRYGSVKVPLFMGIEKYSHVIHIVSSVIGDLGQDYSAFDLLRACFPAGTVSGAPKVRAMEIIAELEGTKRGPYAGAVGYFGFGGNMDTCITIRTIVMVGDTVYLQGGAGIVADSDPMSEYKETLSKIQVLEDAVCLAERWKAEGQV